MSKGKGWSAYIMIGKHFKFYVCHNKTTEEIRKWIEKHCKPIGASFFMCGTEVFFCECK